ncbi:MAG: heparinase II/III-family protein [Verrucomicrobia bacterium]|nr:heparinase II/III-family protein [Verrucomicrobiota bacterium]
MLGDAGRYTYAPGPWRNFFKGPESHNVLLLDGRATRPQRLRTRTPLNRRAEIHESYDVFSGVATFPARGLRGPSYHQRTVYYQRGAFWLVIDRVLTSGNRKLSAHWQFGPEVNTESSRNFLQLWHSFPTTYVPGPQQLFGSESPIAGWKSPNYNVRIPVLQERYQINIRGTTTLVWVIAENVPTLLPQLELIQLDNTGLRVLWHAPDGIHTIDIDL